MNLTKNILLSLVDSTFDEVKKLFMAQLFFSELILYRNEKFKSMLGSE